VERTESPRSEATRTPRKPAKRSDANAPKASEAKRRKRAGGVQRAKRCGILRNAPFEGTEQTLEAPASLNAAGGRGRRMFVADEERKAAAV
jgi:hypothetical protein